MSSPRIIAMRTKAFPNYAIHYNYALKLLFSWRCQWRALQFLNSTVLMGIHEHLRCSCVRIPIEANHGAVSVHAELWYPFPHNKKKEVEKGKKKNLSKCTCKHCPYGRLILEAKEVELSVQHI